jgi:glucokinase
MDIIGVDLGGTKCAVVLGCHFNKGNNELHDVYNKEIAILDKIVFPTEVQKGVKYTLDKIYEHIETILKRNGKNTKEIERIGISCGGPLDSKRGIIVSPPNLFGWDNVHIVELFEKRYKIKTCLQNDANACALAEWKFGVARGYNNVIFLTFGTGLGAGLILDGRLYSGTNDMAGEIGHIRVAENGPVGYGKAGSFEGFCSGGGIAQLARIKVMEKLQMGERVSFCNSMEKLDELNAKLVGDAAEAGDKLAKEIYCISGDYLGRGLSILIDLLNPEIIVIGSIFARSEDLMRDKVLEVIDRECVSYSKDVCKIVPAGLGDELGNYAAMAVAVFENEMKR